MELRTRVTAAMKQARKDRDSAKLSTIRLINAAIKDRDIAARGSGSEDGVDDTAILEILGKMVKQRRESARTYEEGGRLDLAEAELAEIPVIEDFLPRKLSDAEVETAISEALTEVGASSLRDMGKVMGELKAKHGASLDMGLASKLVKESF